jgi:hypothetical protein
MYLEEPHGCVPEDLLGEELLSDVKSKFYWPMDAVRRQLAVVLGPNRPMFVYVDPSYEDATHAFLTLGDREILAACSCDAWKFWFEDESQMRTRLREWYKSAWERYKERRAKGK